MEGYLRLGTDLLTAVERVDASLGVIVLDGEEPPAGEPLPSDNDRALAELQQMMGGLNV